MKNKTILDYELKDKYTEKERKQILQVMKAEEFPCEECTDLIYGCGCRGWSCPKNDFYVWFMIHRFPIIISKS